MSFSKRLSSFLNKHIKRPGNKVKTRDADSTLRYNGELKNVPLPTDDFSLFNDDPLFSSLKESTPVSPPKTNDQTTPKCPKCDGDLSSWDYKNGVLYNFWCNACESKELQQNFSNWTSGDPNIDKLIQDSQLNIGYNMSYLEWIPYEQIRHMKEIGRGGYATVYSATWADGPRGQWNEEKKIWDRCGERQVAVKVFHDSANINPEFLNELKLHSRYFRDSYILQYYGISRQPSTNDFVLILEFANMGNLRNYLQSNPDITWSQKLDILESLVLGLSQVHNNANLTHKDLHPGNVLLSNLGFMDSEPIIGVRPDIAAGTPKCFAELIMSCWDTMDYNRPTIQVIAHTLITWTRELNNIKSGDYYKQFKESDEKRLKEDSQEVTLHPQAIFTSRPLNSFNKHVLR
ncbi:14316_t:CDS:2 [Acaulospora morrowiae]|uniref:14316_t:CDS:1 n=1 Tax=Acaulospora morrowiae TaxID=94023 RepID=A0A9N8VAH3_9GLOM|nr:14316_t:CDS:2 [Acaulospora morrowiae]